jgi:hypothetical protein
MCNAYVLLVLLILEVRSTTIIYYLTVEHCRSDYFLFTCITYSKKHILSEIQDNRLLHVLQKT